MKGWKNSTAFLFYVIILLLIPMVCKYPPPHHHYVSILLLIPMVCKYPPPHYHYVSILLLIPMMVCKYPPPHDMQRLDSLPVAIQPPSPLRHIMRRRILTKTRQPYCGDTPPLPSKTFIA